jgi:hypothetical protein
LASVHEIAYFATFLKLATKLMSPYFVDLIIAVGDELEFLTDGNAYRTLTLNSYNATKLSSLAYDATTRKLFFSDQRHHYGHIFSVSLDNESHRPVEDIVESNWILQFIINFIL